MKIAIASRKGGVGKSSITAGIASLLAADGYSVLAVDLDPQSNLAFMLGADPTAPGTAALLDGQNPVPLEVNERLHVLPGGADLARQDIARLDPEDLADALNGWDYDFILFDNPPGNQHLERLAIVASDKAIVVTNAHPMAILGAERVLSDLESRFNKNRKGPKSWAIVMNMIDARRSLDKNIEEMFENAEDVSQFKVRQDTKISMASAQGYEIVDFAPNCNGARDLRKIKEWCIGRED